MFDFDLRAKIWSGSLIWLKRKKYLNKKSTKNISFRVMAGYMYDTYILILFDLTQLCIFVTFFNYSGWFRVEEEDHRRSPERNSGGAIQDTTRASTLVSEHGHVCSVCCDIDPLGEDFFKWVMMSRCAIDLLVAFSDVLLSGSSWLQQLRPLLASGS